VPALDSPGNRHKDAFAHAAHPAPAGKSARYKSHGVRTHQHMSTGTCTAHHALHRVSRILNIPTVLPRISRLHLLDIRTLASPTTIQLTTQTHIHTSHTHEQTKGRQTACAVVPSLSDTLADCATVATPFLRGKICHVHRPPRCEHASVLLETQGRKTACPVAQSLSDTLADCARPPAQSQHHFSVAKSVTSTAHAKMCARIGVTGNTQGPHTACAVAPSRSPTLQHSRRLRAATGTVPTPFLDAGKSVEPTTHAKMCATVGATGT